MDVAEAENSEANVLYNQLDTSRSEIRLLEIHPAEVYDSPISCTLRTVSLDDGPVYSTLSYVCGDPKQVESVIVNGSSHDVTRNLMAALRRLRTDNIADTKNLWVDAICISQEDPEERNSQIRLMSRLYGKSQRTLGWLGPGNDQTALAIKIIRETGTKFGDTTRPNFSTDLESSNYDIGWWADVSSLWENDRARDESANTAWAAIKHFFELDYWSRVWILQEVVLSKDQVFLCGQDAIHVGYLELFCRLVDLLKKGPEKVLSVAKDNDTVFLSDLQTRIILLDHRTMFWQLRRLISRLNGRDWLITAVKRTEALHATDPRDKIYALLGLCKSDITPDYNISNTYRQVYTSVALKMIERDKNLDILRYCHVRQSVSLDSEENEARPPTWVADWQALSRSREGIMANKDWFSPAQTNMLTYQINNAKTILSVKGILVDSVTESPVRAQHPATAERGDTIEQFVVFAAKFLEEDKKYATGIPRLQALFRILLYDEFFEPTWEWDCERFFEWTASFVFFFVTRVSEGKGIPTGECFDQFCSNLGVSTHSEFRNTLMYALFGTETTYTTIPKWTSAVEAYERGRALRTLFLRECAHMPGKMIFRTLSGYIGLIQGELEQGDMICVLFGCKLPVALRRFNSGFIVVGLCHVPGLMKGEVLEKLKPNGPLEIQDIELR